MVIFSSPSTNDCLLPAQFCDITTEIDIQQREELFPYKSRIECKISYHQQQHEL